MTRHFIGTIILLIIVIAGFLILPIYYTTQIDTAKAQEIIMSEVQLFIDKVADTHKIEQKDLDDLTLAISSTSIPVKFEISREARQVNPDPLSSSIPKQTYTSWVPHENFMIYDDGDIIIIDVEQIGLSFYQSFSARALGMYTPKINFRLARMVR